jgi:fused signal recognition particle receptor
MSEGVAENEATIIEKDATILENVSNNDEKPDENAKTPVAPELPVRLKPPAPKRGRPQGSKDRVPRQRVRIEPIPQPVEQPVEQPAPSPAPAQTVPARTPSPAPSPPSPRTLYRQTSEQLLSLRELMTHQRRTQAAERYASNLHSWTGL